MKRSDSSDSDSAELMTAFRIFTRSLSAVKTPLTISTPTLSLVKTSLFWLSWGWASLHIRQAWIYSMCLKRYRNIRSCKLVFSISENSSQLCRSRIKYLEAVCRLMIWLLNAMHFQDLAELPTSQRLAWTLSETVIILFVNRLLLWNFFFACSSVIKRFIFWFQLSNPWRSFYQNQQP